MQAPPSGVGTRSKEESCGGKDNDLTSKGERALRAVKRHQDRMRVGLILVEDAAEVLDETPTDLLAIDVDRHLPPRFLDCAPDLMVTSPEPAFGPGARNLGEAIRWLARVVSARRAIADGGDGS